LDTDLYQVEQDWSYAIQDNMRLAAEMTLPDERYRAIRQTRQFLIDLCDRTVTPKIPRTMRAEAYRLLRHYPSDYDLERLAEKAPDVIIEKMEPLTRMVMTYKEIKK
jgi:hypothetical protein